MLRRISTKLVLAVLAAVVLPFVAFAFFIDYQIGTKLTRDVVLESLKGLVQDLAGQVDGFVLARDQDAAFLAGMPMATSAIDEHVVEARRLGRPDPDPARPPWSRSILDWAAGRTPQGVPLDTDSRLLQTSELDRFVELKEVYDLILLVDANGRLVTCNARGHGGEAFPPEYLERLFASDYTGEEWFADGLAGEPHRVDHHVSPYRLREHTDPDDLARNYHIGFAQPVFAINRPDEVRGVLYALVSWKHVQDLVGPAVITEYFRGLVGPHRDPSPYAWIWAADADTVIGHPDPSLYGKSITRDVGLPQMVQAVHDEPSGWGSYPEYNFKGVWKNAAFKRTRAPAEGGFHWVVGLGIDNEDIYGTTTELRILLMGGTAIVLLMAILWTLVIARRTTDPIRELQAHTRRVADGNLDEQIAITSGDELGALAVDFNRMTLELKEQRERIVKAEKDAAWREMAKQIAHDIKNPLTPIQLSLDLVERARREKNPGYDEILGRTLDLIGRQVKNLREIASDFYEFTGGRRPAPQPIELSELVDDVLRLHDAWAVENDVDVRRVGRGGRVMADESKLRRVFGNLVSNALQAMPEGGSLEVEVAPAEVDGRPCMRVRVRDDGVGVPEEAREHLFEPYFTTRSEGTGLGLAIAKRVIEELGGAIELRPAEGGGTIAEVVLPRIAEEGEEA